MTQYMLAVHHSPTTPQPSQEQMQQAFAQVDAVNKEMVETGTWVFGGGLEAPDVASVVHNENGQELITDGPFGETKEHLGGFWVIEAPDLDAALVWAHKASKACMGPVEVRPFQSE
jgi:hypothetical protein